MARLQHGMLRRFFALCAVGALVLVLAAGVGFATEEPEGGSETPPGSSEETPGGEDPGGSSEETPGGEDPGGGSEETPGGEDPGGGSEETPGGEDPGGGSEETPGGEDPGGGSEETPGGEDPGGGSEVTPPTSYTLTVDYVYKDGAKAADTVTKTIAVGLSASVPSPKIDGYTPDKASVDISSMTADKHETVTYTKNEDVVKKEESEEPDEPSEAPTDNPAKDTGAVLTIRAGYYGYGYEDMAAFTAAELRSFANEIRGYSFIDHYPAPTIMAASGTPLEAVLLAAGIDVGSVQRLYFRAGDGYTAGDFEYTMQVLTGTTRYYFPNLVKYWDKATEKPGLGADQNPEVVPVLMVYQEYHDRWEPYPKYSKMYATPGFRLVYGMTSIANNGAGDGFSYSIHDITAIDVQLVGSPPEIEAQKEAAALAGADKSNATKGTGNDDADTDGKGSGVGSGVGDGTGGGTGGGTAASGDGPGAGVTVSGETTQITMDDGTIVQGREINAPKVLMEIAFAGGGGGGKSDGDDPWNDYEIAEDSAPLQIPQADGSAATLVGSVLGIAFALGAAKQTAGTSLFGFIRL
ncbi:MAG: hypothetical protein LBR00_06290 [Clostridiales Family XIII bacterium]|jgi:hypothetical protein|nr:hypothetical protein [Clostridiales Family XIII bacterium]